MFNKKKILLHCCCAPCASSVFERLESEEYIVDSFFFNPNIYPINEYQRRRDELIKFCKIRGNNLIIKEDFTKWQELVKGLESEKEGGARCAVCFRARLEESAKYALENQYDFFTTVLTVSPHKNSKIINEIGYSIQEKYGIPFLEADFKKKNGFKRSMELSREYNLYRQNYCGCKYSIRVP